MSKRAAELLRVAARFIKENGREADVVFYDETECDGQCLADDCLSEADRIDPPKEDLPFTVEASTTTPCCGATYKDTDHILISACEKCGREYA